jgi:hypothetical protein
MKFDALSGEPTNSSRGRYPASGPRLQTAPKTGSRSRVATPSGAALQPRFRRNPGPAPWLTSGISPRPAVGVSASHKGAIKLAAGHSRKRECRSRLLRRAPRADGLPECEPPPTVRSAPITVAMPGRIFWKLRRWGPNRYSASRPSMSIGLCANWGGRPQVIYKLPYGSVRSKRRSVLSRFRFGRSLTR